MNYILISIILVLASFLYISNNRIKLLEYKLSLEADNSDQQMQYINKYCRSLAFK